MDLVFELQTCGTNPEHSPDKLEICFWSQTEPIQALEHLNVITSFTLLNNFLRFSKQEPDSLMGHLKATEVLSLK